MDGLAAYGEGIVGGTAALDAVVGCAPLVYVGGWEDDAAAAACARAVGLT